MAASTMTFEDLLLTFVNRAWRYCQFQNADKYTKKTMKGVTSEAVIV
jgi:hypothetical protein